jgi:hypothetical protein
MGTRSVLTFVDHDGNIGEDVALLTIYRQFDGYLEGRGKELAEFMVKMTMRNGYGDGDVGGMHANGMGCLAAQFLAAEKNGFYEGESDFDIKRLPDDPIPKKPWNVEDSIGNVYVQLPQMWPDTEDFGIEFFYQVEIVSDEDKGQKIVISVCDIANPGEYLFRGSPERMLLYIKHYMDEDGEINRTNPYAGVEKADPDLVTELFT